MSKHSPKAETIKREDEIEAEFKDLKTTAPLRRALLLVNVGGQYHEQNYLSATINLLKVCGDLNKDQTGTPVVQKGVLQKHNYFIFTPKITDEDLISGLIETPDNIDDENLALCFAVYFGESSLQTENDYINRNVIDFLRFAPAIRFGILR